MGQLLCSEQTDARFIQVKLTKSYYIATLLRVQVYAGFLFIEGSVYAGFLFIEGSVYAGFWFIQVPFTGFTVYY